MELHALNLRQLHLPGTLPIFRSFLEFIGDLAEASDVRSGFVLLELSLCQFLLACYHVDDIIRVVVSD